MSDLSSISRLATDVRAWLRETGEPVPRQRVLENLFSICYEVSLKTEEGSRLRFTLTYQDPGNPDPEPPPNIRAHRWTWTMLAKPLPLNSTSLAKLAAATPPYAATIGVYHDSNQGLIIWGLSDQELHWYNYTLREGSDAFIRPGAFQVEVYGTASFDIVGSFGRIGAIQLGNYRSMPVDVVGSGPVSQKLKRVADSHIEAVRIHPNTWGDAVVRKLTRDDRSFVRMGWEDCLLRLLLGIKRQRHGGAVLFSELASELKPKYRAPYNGLESCLQRLAAANWDESKAEKSVWDKLVSDKPVPSKLVRDYSIATRDVEDAKKGLDGAVALAVSLSRVDGLIWFRNGFQLGGFGVEITTKLEPSHVYLARTASGTIGRCKEIEIERFGTRHRSMIRYCAKYPDSVGLIVSQDGEVRAVTSVDSRVVLWDDIALSRNVRVD